MNNSFILFLLSILIMACSQDQSKMIIPTQKIQNLVIKSVDNENIFGTVICISKGPESYSFSSGNMSDQSQYFIASVSKLYTTAIIMKLKDNGQLKLDDKISNYLSFDIVENLHIHKGIDYSDDITIRHLLSNTSGLPDYFEQKIPGGQSLKEKLTKGNDQILEFTDIIEISKSMKTKFPPGKKGNALYSDTNFQLLGRIIEIITGLTLSEVYDIYIFDPLKLNFTYLYQDVNDTIPADLYYKD